MDSENLKEIAWLELEINSLRAIRTGRCRERRYADHIFIQVYFRMHHFAVKFSRKFLRKAATGH